MDLENDNQMGLNDRKGKGPEWKAVKRRLSSEGQGCRQKEYGEDEDGASWRSGPAESLYSSSTCI